MRGLPVQGRSRESIRTLYWALGTRLGSAVTQNLRGDLVAEITDRGLDVNNLDVKPSQTNAGQRPHTDPADIVGLLCINAAQSGGLSRIASTMAIYNAVLEDHPEYLEWLYRGFHHNLRGDASQAAPFGCTPKPIPVYRYYGGKLSCVFNASTIKEAQHRMGERVPESEMRAIDYMVDLARSDEYRLDMEFQPGDLQILNNYTVMHWRTEFQDWPQPERKRLLYRLWLKALDPRYALAHRIPGLAAARAEATPVPAVAEGTRPALCRPRDGRRLHHGLANRQGKDQCGHLWLRPFESPRRRLNPGSDSKWPGGQPACVSRTSPSQSLRARNACCSTRSPWGGPGQARMASVRCRPTRSARVGRPKAACGLRTKACPRRWMKAARAAGSLHQRRDGCGPRFRQRA